MMKRCVDWGVLFFLLGNLVVRFAVIFNYPPYNLYIAVLLGGVGGACMGGMIWPRYLKPFLFLFGFSFFLFGFGSIDLQSRIFELLVCLVALTLFIINQRAEKSPVLLNPSMGVLLFSYVALSCFSLLLLPLRQIGMDLWLFGFPDALFYLFIGPPYETFYPVTACIRLVFYGVFVVVMARTTHPGERFKFLFSGIFIGAVFSAFIGLLDYYGAISLKMYRFGTPTAGVLHSTFGNRGWFGEFIVISFPFILIGFMGYARNTWMKLLLFASLILCEVALILSGGRSGWVSYPVILFVCWLFFYFFKDGRFTITHFRWQHLIKVGVSVPITLAISFLLIFHVFMPLSDYVKTRNQGNFAGIDSEQTSRFIKAQTARIIEPAGRFKVWSQGIDVGREKSWFGMGYESFCWHAHILSAIPQSIYTVNKENKHKNILQTPHNIYIQLFVSGGLAGLLLYLMMVGYAMVVLMADLIQNRRVLHAPVIICMIIFHTFGIFQSMQYIPMIWLFIFLCLGYVMTIDEIVLPLSWQSRVEVMKKIGMVIAATGFFVYLAGFESHDLAEKYDLEIYGRDQVHTAGFFHQSKRWQYGKEVRWTGKKGRMYLPAGTDEVALEFHCRTPDVDNDPVEVVLTSNGQVLDKITFNGKKDTVKNTYKLSPEKLDKKLEEKVIELTVSRTWVPHSHLNNFDRRELGIGVKLL